MPFRTRNSLSVKIPHICVLILLVVFLYSSNRTRSGTAPKHPRSFTISEPQRPLEEPIDVLDSRDSDEDISVVPSDERDIGYGLLTKADDEASEAGFELVLSHHRSDPGRIKPWTDMVRKVQLIDRLGMKLVIYTTNTSVEYMTYFAERHCGPVVDISESSPTLLKDRTGANEIHRIPNTGREGATVLHHIISNYDESDHLAPRLSMFAAADAPHSVHPIHNTLEAWFQTRLSQNLRQDTGFLGLSRHNDPCLCGDCGDEGKFPLLAPLTKYLDKRPCTEKSVSTLWNEFIVSRRRIKSRNIKLYQWLEKMVNAPDDHWLHRQREPRAILDKELGGKSTPENPLFAHTLERTWSILFDCAFWERKGLNVSREAVCNKADCLCLDPPDNGMERSGESEQLLRKGVGGANRFYDNIPLASLEAEGSDWEKMHAATENDQGITSQKSEARFNSMRAAR